MTNVIVSGYMIRHPVVGNMLAFAHYLVGLHKMGCTVAYIEHSAWPDACYHPVKQCHGNDFSYGITAAQSLLAHFGVSLPIYYIDDNGSVHSNLRGESGEIDLQALFSSVDLYLNLGGVCSLEPAKLAKKRALVDMDPLFTQLGRFSVDDIENYDVYFSYGCNIGNRGSVIPAAGRYWNATVPPVVPEYWQGLCGDVQNTDAGSASPCRFTTIANWSAYGAVEYLGKSYGQKDIEFRRFRQLPARCAATLEIAASGMDHETAQAFRRSGWLISDASLLSASVQQYTRYIVDSSGEFSVAKNAYVATRSGWFSDRSVCYLAAGRPVIVQDTGIADWLPVGEGVLTFATVAEAVSATSRLIENYAVHSTVARDLVSRYFHYIPVLTRLLERSV